MPNYLKWSIKPFSYYGRSGYSHSTQKPTKANGERGYTVSLSSPKKI